MSHVIIIIDGIETPVEHDDKGGNGGGGNRVAEYVANHHTRELQTFRVVDTPEGIAEFREMVSKWCKNRKKD